jgi:hypothetical protein
MEIKAGDVLPPKPWICCLVTEVVGEGRGLVNGKAYGPLFISHHALSRSAQRWGVRTVDDVRTVARAIWRVTEADSDKRDAATWYVAPPAGRRIVIPDVGVLVLQQHERDGAMVAATVL